jgi:REP element-mobilizing transposase RayT
VVAVWAGNGKGTAGTAAFRLVNSRRFWQPVVMDENDSFYRRRLPHWEKPGAIYFVTFRVAGSLPRSLLQQADAEIRSIQQRLQQQGRPASEFERERQAILERYLDEDRTNPILSNPPLAALVRDALLFHAGQKYDLLAWCIMPNHVHLLLKPLPKGTPPSRRLESGEDTAGTVAILPAAFHSLAEILHSLKSYTAHQAGKLGLVSGSLWEREYFDRWTRNDEAVEYYRQYIRNNPLKAGLVPTPTEYPWLG